MGGARGGGKSSCNYAKILTFSGWKFLWECKIGDQLINPVTGGNSQIIGVFPQGKREIYKLTFDDGASTEVDLEHLWYYKLPNRHRPFTKNSMQREYVKTQLGYDIFSKDRFGFFRIGTTENLRTYLDQGLAPRIPLTAPVLFQKNGRISKGEIPAYFIGLFLGDGYHSQMTFYTDDQEIKDYIASFDMISSDGHHFRFKSGSRVRRLFDCWLRNNDLKKAVSDTKFIPDHVFTAPIDYRVDFLAGLLDTDGYVDDRGHVEFTSTSYKLVKGVQELVWGLGGKATISEPVTGAYKNEQGEKVECKQYWRVYIWLLFASKVFKLKRKAKRCVDQWNGGFENMRKLVDITYAGKEEATCIKVSSPHGLYITDDYIVTHNTDAGLVWLLYDIDNPKLAELVIRRNADDLTDWVIRAKRMYEGTGVTTVGNPPIFKFPSGAYIKTGHLKDENAYEKYQGHEYQRILIEELTQIPVEESYLKLISSCRSTVPGLQPQVFATTNPGGPGHKWVKSRFIDPAIPGQVYKDPITGRTRIFIPARVDDNPYLMDRDPGYIRFLDGLPGDLRRAWRDGSWDLIEVQGAYYGQWMLEAKRQKRICTVPYDPAALVHTAWDLGMDDSTAIWFFQTIGQEIHLIEYYENSGESLKHYAKYLQAKEYVYGMHFAPHDIEVRSLSTGKTRRQTARELGLDFIVCPRLEAKEDGIDAVRNLFHRFWFDAKKCELGISCLENYRKEFNEKMQTFMDKPRHDWACHGADSMQTLAQGMQMLQFRNRYKRPKPKRRVCGYGG